MVLWEFDVLPASAAKTDRVVKYMAITVAAIIRMVAISAVVTLTLLFSTLPDEIPFIFLMKSPLTHFCLHRIW